ncbi:hypothetical protein [uncultured Gammaproteobacteria bacterium]|nr:hypothetical protein [uncultured Gammaproteobacteria bacterium]CAC9543200.1 hypothetical protein [uncultured Gammaproteobacteria bacterium]CAC9959960.1 hypothetical protein [uncultured Gammaproteobacteria bacterium]
MLTYNEYNSNKNRLKKLVFISESKGIESLRNRLDEKKLIMLKNTHKLNIELIGI